MEITRSKIAAALLVVGYVAAASIWGQPTTVRGAPVGAGAAAVMLGVFLLVPLSLIWFPEFWGDHVGGRITRSSHEGFVAFMGWMLLVGLPLVVYLLDRRPPE